MSIGTDTITIYLGEDTVIPFVMTTGEDITLWTLEFNIRGSGVRVTLTPTVLTSSTFEVTLADTDYESVLRPGTFLYDVWRIDPGEERVIARGDCVVLSVARNVVTA